MKINTKNVVVAFLLIMSFTSYIFLSNIEVNEPEPLNHSELQKQYNEEAATENDIFLPDFALVKKVLGLLQKGMTL